MAKDVQSAADGQLRTAQDDGAVDAKEDVIGTVESVSGVDRFSEANHAIAAV